MKDIHSHLLYGIDDGSKSLEESLYLLKEMEKKGITDLILTPHYIEESNYNCDNLNKEELFNIFKNKVNEHNIKVNLYLGNEVFFTNNIVELHKSNKIKTLNNSKYVLFEFPMRHLYTNTKEVIQNLVAQGYIPILAHPERYEIFQHHPDKIEEYMHLGVLLQGNFTSLFGKYGRVPKKILKYYLKKHWITFLGSDTHHDVKFDCKKLEKKLLRITKDEEYVNKLMNENFNKIINNEDIGIIR